MAGRGARPALRLVALLCSFVVLLVFVAFRLVQLQIVQAQPLEKRGAQQRIRHFDLLAPRGGIFDRNMTALAVSADARAIYANPHLVDNAAAAALQIAPLLGVSEASLLPKLMKDSSFVYLARDVPLPAASAVLKLGLPAIGSQPEMQRVYPAGSVAGQVLGFVGVDDRGLSGIESKFDATLRGRSGEQVIERDAHGRPIPQGDNSLTAAEPGKGLELTLDRDIQYAAEQALARGVRTTHAKDGMAIVMDPRTGDVLAMANWPPMDPNSFADATADAQRNRALTDAYEPGSVNKVITASAAIEAGIASPDEVLTVPGKIHVADKDFHDLHAHGTERITYAEAIAQSSNIGTIEIALRLGARRVHDALRAFGLGSPTGIGFPGESAGILLPLDQWSGTSIATIPIGQGIAASPIQVASVYATIANDGVRVRPRLVRGIVEQDGTVTPVKPVPAERVVRPYTAAQVRGMLIGVVEHGTGSRAQIPGYLVGGKTGTARVPLLGRRGYSNDIVTTFAGMAPADHPRLVVMVALNNPRPRFSALTATPVFREIMQFALAHTGVAPTIAIHDGKNRRGSR